MLKKLMKVLLIILSSIIILAVLLFGFAKTYIYIKDWKYEQKALQNPEYVKKIKDRNAWKKSLTAKNDRIIRIDIYNTNHEYGYYNSNSKSIEKYQKIGDITDDKQLKEFKTEFKRILLSKQPRMDTMSISQIWINIVYDDGTNAVAQILGKEKTGRLRIFDFKTNEIPDKNDLIRLRFRMRSSFWQTINDNIYNRYKNEKNEIDYKKLDFSR